MQDKTWKTVVFLAILAIEVALVVRLFTAPPDQQDLLIGAVLVLAAALALTPRLFDLLVLQLPGFTAQLREVQASVDATNTSVRATDEAVAAVNDKLDMLFALSISDWQYHNLEKIASGEFGKYVRSFGLENDLRHLRNHGWVDIPSVRAIPESGDELCLFVRATEAGKLFVDLRQSMGVPSPTLLRQTALEPASTDAAPRVGS